MALFFFLSIVRHCMRRSAESMYKQTVSKMEF